jgi:hypothetical protein
MLQPLFMEAKLFMHVVKKWDAFLIYFFPHQMLCHNNMKSHFNTMNTMTCSKRKMLTPCQIINHMITWLILKNVRNLNLNPFMAFQKYIDKNLKKGSFNIPNFQLKLQSCLSWKRWTLCECVLIIYCDLNWFTMKNQYLLPLISGLLNQLNHAKMYIEINLDGTYNLVCIQKDNEWKICSKHVMAILNISWSPWPYKCTYKFAILDEWCLLWIPRSFHVLLHQ